MEIREYINEVQDTVGNYDAGSFIESLWDAAEHYGLRPSGLFAGARGKRGKTALRRWSMDEVRAELDAGHPLVTQVWYRGLPGREKKPYDGDHYIVLIGYTADDVIYNDPIDKDGFGASRRMTLGARSTRPGEQRLPVRRAGGRAAPATRPSLLAGRRPSSGPRRPARPAVAGRAPAPGDMPLAAYPGTWTPASPASSDGPAGPSSGRRMIDCAGRCREERPSDRAAGEPTRATRSVG